MSRARHPSHVARPTQVTSRIIAIAVVIGVAFGNIHCGKDLPTSQGPIPTGLAFMTQPTSVSAGAAITPAVEITVLDAQGNIAPNSTATITLAVTSGTGVVSATLGGTSSRVAVGGIATFTDLTVDKAGAGYTLTATAGDLVSATSSTFTIKVGSPNGLAFAVQPTGMTARRVMAPAVEVTVLDSQGNPVTNTTTPIVLVISASTGAGGAVLGGTLSRAPVNGVATFSDLSIDKAGTGYSLTASTSGLTSATSSLFDIGPWAGVPTAISLQSDPGDYIGAGLTYQYTQADAIITVSENAGHLSLRVDGDEGWSGIFQVPGLTRLEPGTYTGLTRGSLDWSGEGRGCNMLTGQFTVDSVAYRSNGSLAAIDLRFEQHCEGRAAALYGVIHWDSDDPTSPPGPVTPVPAGLWQPAQGSTPAAGDFVYLESETGDYIGRGQTLTYTPATATITVTATGGRVSIGVSGTEWWSGNFQAMSSLAELQSGYYPDLQRYPFHNPSKGGLTWSGQGRGCNRLTGWFAIDSITYVAGVLKAVYLRFEQHCEGGTTALYGAISWAE